MSHIFKPALNVSKFLCECQSFFRSSKRAMLVDVAMMMNVI